MKRKDPTTDVLSVSVQSGEPEETAVSTMPRRDFIWTSALGVGGLLVLDTLRACRPAEPSEIGDGSGFIPFSEEDDVHYWLPTEFTEESVPTTCWIGKQDCGMLARVVSQTVGD